MPYRLINNEHYRYEFYEGEAFAEYDAGEVIIPYLVELFDSNVHIEEVSVRKGRGCRSEKLLKLSFSTSKGEKNMFIYCFQTESGGRWRLIRNGRNEARVQWRASYQWEPALSEFAVAKMFSEALLKGEILDNKRCFILAVYKRHEFDNDIVISGIYPTQAQGVETSSKSNKSIQYNYNDLQTAFKEGISITPKTNDHLVIHFKPKFLGWYLLNSDKLHALDEYDFSQYMEVNHHEILANHGGYYMTQFVDQVLEGKDIEENYTYREDTEDYSKNVTSNDSYFNKLLTEGKMLEALEYFIKDKASKGEKVDIIQAKRIVQGRFISIKNGV